MKTFRNVVRTLKIKKNLVLHGIGGGSEMPLLTHTITLRMVYCASFTSAVIFTDDTSVTVEADVASFWKDMASHQAPTLLKCCCTTCWYEPHMCFFV